MSSIFSPTVSNPLGSIGTIIGNFTTFGNDLGFVTLRLQDTIPAGQLFYALWRSTGGTANMRVEVSLDNTNWTTQPGMS
ncbi:hypothetical protein, partial [Listeria monocytogenes]|uniref:hypothetical protein n=1 Tax=Listeria monocytogenes TaxID=1639 RepID=UPI002FDBA59E